MTHDHAHDHEHTHEHEHQLAAGLVDPREVEAMRHARIAARVERDRAQLLALRQGDYGIDAPAVPAVLAAVGVLMLVFGIVSAALLTSIIGTALGICSGLFLLLSAGSYLYTTRMGKFQVWSELLTDLRLRGDERILDMGCGRGAVLLMTAQLVPNGRATGVDLWQSKDQSGNDAAVTRHNAELEAVGDRVEVVTGDMRSLPFDDGAYDLVVSSLAIHNIPNTEGRQKAITEAIRVLKPGGRLLVADIQATHDYAEALQQNGMSDVALLPLGWRFWYGGPWVATTLVSATKPA